MKSMTSSMSSGECASGIDRLLDGVPEQYGYQINELWDLTVPSTWRRVPDDSIFLDDMRVHLVRGGRGSYWVEGKTIPMSRGLLMFFHPMLKFGHEADADDPPSIISCHFDLVLSGDGTPQRSRLPALFWSCLLDTEEYDRILPYFENISFLYKQSSDWKFKNQLCSSGIHQLLGIVRNLGVSLQQGVFDRRVEEVRLNFERYPLDDRPLSSISADYGLGQDYFSALFHKQVGMSLRSYRLKCRMDYARYLITLRGDVKSVAAELGYSDQFVFSRLFKRVHGINPSRCKSGFKTV